MSIVKLLLAEYFGKADLVRSPEDDSLMENPDNVLAFTHAGHRDGVLFPIYYFIAQTCSRYLPHGARVLDLGSGSGQYLQCLGLGRPDLEIVGIDLSRTMVELGNKLLNDRGLYPRIKIVKGDMTSFLQEIEGRFDLISTNFALHHLSTIEKLEQCLFQVGGMMKSQQCGLWIFDHCRPKTRTAAKMFPEIFMPASPSRVQQDSFCSLMASWSYDEIQRVCYDQIGLKAQGWKARIMPFYQIHRYRNPRYDHADDHIWQYPVPLNLEQTKHLKQLREILFPQVK